MCFVMYCDWPNLQICCVYRSGDQGHDYSDCFCDAANLDLHCSPKLCSLLHHVAHLNHYWQVGPSVCSTECATQSAWKENTNTNINVISDIWVNISTATRKKKILGVFLICHYPGTALWTWLSWQLSVISPFADLYIMLRSALSNEPMVLLHWSGPFLP